MGSALFLLLSLGLAHADCPDVQASTADAVDALVAARLEEAEAALARAELGFSCGSPPTAEVLARFWLAEAAASSVALDKNMMQVVLIYAFAAATLGGFDSPLGAVVGGLIIGLVSELVVGYVGLIGPDLRLLPGFLLVLIVLLVRPQGLFGTAKVGRA